MLREVAAGRLAADAGGRRPLRAPTDTLDGASDTGTDADDASPQALQQRLQTQFNRRWQLAAAIIDHVCRYLFLSLYVLCMVVLIVVLVAREE